MLCPKHKAKDFGPRIRHPLHLTGRRVLVAEVFVADSLDEGVHPRQLRFLLAKLVVEIRVSIAIYAIFRRTVRLPLVGIVEPSDG